MNIIQDTREKIGKWEFSDANVIVKKLESGDYSLVGLESVICIERKRTTSEIAINLGSDFSRFKRELERMKSIPFSYIICEFTFQSLLDFPKGSNISKSLLSSVKINGKYLVKLLSSFKEDYGVEVIYAGNRDNAIDEAERIFKTVLEIKG